MSLFSEQDLQNLAGRSSSTLSGSSALGLPSFAHEASGRLHHDLNPHGMGTLGPGMSLSSEMNDFQQQVRQQQQQQGFDGELHQYSGRRVGGSQDLLASDGAALASMMSEPDQGQRTESSQKRQPWTARLSFLNPMNRLWNRKESSNSTSGGSSHYSNYCGDIDKDLPIGNTSKDSNMTTAPVRDGRKVNHALRENGTVFKDDGEGDDDIEVLEPSSNLAKESTAKGNDMALTEGPSTVSHSDTQISPVSPDTPKSSVHGKSGTPKMHDTLSAKEDVPVPTRDESSPPVPGDKSMTDTPGSEITDSVVASDTVIPISKTHPAGVACLSARSLASNAPSSSCSIAQRMKVRPLPPGDESGDAFYEDAVLSDSDEPAKRKITDMDLHPSREFCKHAKCPLGMTAVLSLPQIDFVPRTLNKPQTSKIQDPKQPPPQQQGQKASPTLAPKNQRRAKLLIVPQLEPRPVSPALARSLHANNPNDLDDDDSDDDLYDPEFGIGPTSGHRQRRRRSRFRVPGMSSPASSTHAVIPSADVISAAAKAVSQGWSESDALHMAMMGNSHVNNNNSNISNSNPTTPISLSRSSSRVSRAKKQQPGDLKPMLLGSRQVSRHVSISDADLSMSRSSSFHSLSYGSKLPLFSPANHVGGASGNISVEHSPLTPKPKLGRRATRLIASNRPTISGLSESSSLRRDSNTGQILAPAIATPAVASSGPSSMDGLDDALVAPLAMYPTEKQQHT